MVCKCFCGTNLISDEELENTQWSSESQAFMHMLNRQKDELI